MPSSLASIAFILTFHTVLVVAQSNTSANQTDLELRASLIPWTWTVRPDDPNATCAFTSSILGTFAATNIIVTLCSTVFGDRRVVHYLTCGFLGSPTGNTWRFTFVIPLGIQLGANAIIAYLYSRTTGYGSIPIGQLVLFFVTRPRLGYLLLSWLIPRGRQLEPVIESFTNPTTGRTTHYASPTAKKVGANGYYEASAKGSMLAEVFLLLISTYYYGRTVHFAASHGYYIVGGKLSGHPHAKDASIMYAGALLALLAVVPTLVNLDSLLKPLEKGHVQSLAADIDDNGRPIEGNEESKTEFLRFTLITIAATSFLGAWLFWAGYVRLASNLYCPPKLVESGAVWSVFSLVGVLLGGGH